MISSLIKSHEFPELHGGLVAGEISLHWLTRILAAFAPISCLQSMAASESSCCPIFFQPTQLLAQETYSLARQDFLAIRFRHHDRVVYLLIA
ncbi:hypothetical protein JS562_54185, partial [Agrobacterium sp. S2]|nr:hypothetical protein [Agrobacterium sp. S2]